MDPDEAANLNGSDHFCRLIGETRRLMKSVKRREPVSLLLTSRRPTSQNPKAGELARRSSPYLSIAIYRSPG